MVFMKLRQLTICAVFIAVMAVSAHIKIPAPWGVPFTLQMYVSFLCALILPVKLTLIVHSVYLALGLIGLPVFSSGGGLGYIFTASFGYLFGMCLGSVLSCYIYSKQKHGMISSFLCCSLVILISYSLGAPYMAIITGIISEGILKVIAVGALVFLPADILKAIAAVFTANAVEKSRVLKGL